MRAAAAVRHAYIITNNANHSYCQILGMRHQVDGCNENTIIRVYIVTRATLNNIQSKITKNSSTKQTKLHSNQSLPPRKHHQRKRLRLGGQHPLFAPRKGIHDGPEDTHAINMFNDGIANAQRLVGIVSTKRFRERDDRSQGHRCQSGRSGAIAESRSALDVIGDEVVRVLSRFVLSVIS